MKILKILRGERRALWLALHYLYEMIFFSFFLLFFFLTKNERGPFKFGCERGILTQPRGSKIKKDREAFKVDLIEINF